MPFLPGLWNYGVLCSLTGQAEGDRQSLVDEIHGIAVQGPHSPFEPLLVECSDLFEKHYGILLKPRFDRVYFYMGGQLGLLALAGYGRRDNGGAVFVSHIVLNNKYRPYSSLLRAYHGT